jgi:hypothetical protein
LEQRGINVKNTVVSIARGMREDHYYETKMGCYRKEPIVQGPEFNPYITKQNKKQQKGRRMTWTLLKNKSMD